MAKEKITGAEALMRSLEHQGVTTLFGYPGGAIMVRVLQIPLQV